MHAAIDPQYQLNDYFPLDLSIYHSHWQTHDSSDYQSLAAYLEQERRSRGKKVAFGGYLEQRALYRRAARFQTGQVRDIHLGLDLWAPAGTTVHAILEARVHSFANHEDAGNYGPTILLEHKWQGKPLYSLYGHLSLDSLERIQQLAERGKLIPAGTVIGALGDRSVNGGYVPHLHLQLMLDLGAYKGDYPGVCSAADLDFYTNNTLDPTPLLGLISK